MGNKLKIKVTLPMYINTEIEINKSLLDEKTLNELETDVLENLGESFSKIIIETEKAEKELVNKLEKCKIDYGFDDFRPYEYWIEN